MKLFFAIAFIITCALILAFQRIDVSSRLVICADKSGSLLCEGSFWKSKKHALFGSKGSNLSTLSPISNLTKNTGSVKKIWQMGNEHSVRHACDYSRGKWVKDKNRFFYSGEMCKQWLSGMWACRLMERPNFDYERYRWQPQGCDLPRFDGQTFLARMQNKVLAFVGDSIGRQQYQSMMCMITAGKQGVAVEDVGLKFGLYKPRGAPRANGTAHKFTATNTTVIYHWSASLCEIDPLNIADRNTQYALHLDRPVFFLQKHIEKLDVLVLNTGHHWNKEKLEANKWVMHMNGKPITDDRIDDVKAAYNLSVHNVIGWVNEQLKTNHSKAKVYMRSLSPRHFFGGDWNSGGTCDENMLPVERKIPAERKNVRGLITRDQVAESAVSGTKVHLLNVTYLSQFRDEAHISMYDTKQKGQDCVHWCLPGVPDVWNEILYADLFFGHGFKQNFAQGEDERL